MVRGASLLRGLCLAKESRLQSVNDALAWRGQPTAGFRSQPAAVPLYTPCLGVLAGPSTGATPLTRSRGFTKQPEPVPATHKTADDPLASVLEPRVVKLYRGPWIRSVAFVMRVKVIQLVATGAAALPLLLHIRGEAVATGEIIGSGLLTSFAGLASWALWFYGQRFVGELALVYLPAEQLRHGVDLIGQQPSVSQPEHAPGPGPFVAQGVSGLDVTMCLRFSTLDFWGKRQDELVELSRVEAPLAGLRDDQMGALAAATFLPLSVRGDKQYLLSLRHGSLLQKQLLRHVLRGEWDEVRAGVDALPEEHAQQPA